jgi:hypothetical protein
MNTPSPEVISVGTNSIVTTLRAIKDVGPDITIFFVAIIAILYVIWWTSKQRSDVKDLIRAITEMTQSNIQLKDKVDTLNSNMSEFRQFLYNMKGKS